MKTEKSIQSLCRDCINVSPFKKRCPNCGSARLLDHPELNELTIAHMDCDAFFASVEKRDRPELHDKPLIIGGGKRGVVSTCCYIARTYGIHSAMPMYQAKKLCPHAIIIPPSMDKYSEAGKAVKTAMERLTPLVQTISIDEAFLDLSGTQRLHGCPPAQSLAQLAKEIEEGLGITISVGLSYNKYLAKVASDQNKPKGFTVIGRGEVVEFLAPRPVSLIWGVGKALNKKMKQSGITTIDQLQAMGKIDLIKRFGTMGSRLYHFSRGEDLRDVKTDSIRKSVSNEHTFNADISDGPSLESMLWIVAEKVSSTLKAKKISGNTITLKLKTTSFKSITRTTSLDQPTQMSHAIFEAASRLLKKEVNGTKYRLIGVGVSSIKSAIESDQPDLLNIDKARLDNVEKAQDKIKARFGKSAIQKGRALKPTPRQK